MGWVRFFQIDVKNIWQDILVKQREKLIFLFNWFLLKNLYFLS